jgi:hypothetical protein
MKIAPLTCFIEGGNRAHSYIADLNMISVVLDSDVVAS